VSNSTPGIRNACATIVFALTGATAGALSAIRCARIRERADVVLTADPLVAATGAAAVVPGRAFPVEGV
jgi:hypothetical protein